MTLRVLHCIPSIGSHTGGPPRALIELCCATSLVAADAEITIAASTLGISDQWLTEARQRLPTGTKVMLFQHWGRHTTMVAPGMLLWLASRIKSFHVVHIHSVFHPMSTAAAWIARLRRIPYVVRPHGVLSPYTFRHRRTGLKKVYFRLVDKPNLNHAAAIHFTMQAELEQTRVLGDWPQAVVIPLPYAPSTGFQSHRATRDPHQVLFLSRLQPNKGLHLLLRAFAEVSRQFPAARLVVAGAGDASYERSMKALASTLGISGRTAFAGFVEGAQKEELLLTSSVFVLPSEQENFGIAIVEAMAAGLPVIVSDQIDLAAHIIKARAGVAVAPDISHLAAALLMLLSDEGLRREMGSRGAEVVRSTFAPAVVGRQLVEMYTQCIG